MKLNVNCALFYFDMFKILKSHNLIDVTLLFCCTLYYNYLYIICFQYCIIIFKPCTHILTYILWIHFFFVTLITSKVTQNKSKPSLIKSPSDQIQITQHTKIPPRKYNTKESRKIHTHMINIYPQTYTTMHHQKKIQGDACMQHSSYYQNIRFERKNVTTKSRFFLYSKFELVPFWQ